jgi:glycosyltransferase involved in cell wall biosynthesis
MPQGPQDMKGEHVNLIIASNIAGYKIHIKTIPTLLKPYMSEEKYSEEYQRHVERLKKSSPTKALYGKDIYEEVYRFSKIARLIALSEEFDIIHCHDWMTFPAGIEAKNATGKPLVLHVHATEFDRTGGNSVNQYVYDMEKVGMQAADRILSVSAFTKNKIIQYYGISADKIEVVHNAVEFPEIAIYEGKKHAKTVLFLGRLTLQKGPDYFIEATKKVIDYDPEIRFIIVGTGDMESRMIDRVAQLGIGQNVLFAGFLSGNEVDKAYQAADLYVMPSVSEPFGITPLEALRNNIPVIISKQSGVSEVLKNALKVDFWDIEEMANMIITTLNYSALHTDLKAHGVSEVQTFNWDIPAEKCVQVYNKLLSR